MAKSGRQGGPSTVYNGHSDMRMLLLTIVLMTIPSTAAAQTTIPTTFDVLADDFESGRLDQWNLAPGSTPLLTSAAAHAGAFGLAVSVTAEENHLVQGGGQPVARAQEGYLSFWFDPNASIIPDGPWTPGAALRIATVKGPSYGVLVGIRATNSGGLGYHAFLEYADGSGTLRFDDQSGSFALADGWQHITIGYRAGEWVAAWVDGTLQREVDIPSHEEPYGSVLEIGKTNLNTSTSPSGVLYFDDVAFQLPRYSDLWVDAVHGSDGNDGLSAGTAFRSIGRASDLAGPGTVVHVQPGLYRESIRPAQGGASGEPCIYTAEQGLGTVVVRGSLPSADLGWTQLTSNTIGLPSGVDPRSLYWTDLTAAGLSGPPRFVVTLDASGAVANRLPLAREPDWTIRTPWKQHELWWAADGGSSPAGCNPAFAPDCDVSSRSSLQLTDQSNDTSPTGIEAGNLATLGNLTGATLVALDCLSGHYYYRRRIVQHSVAEGRVTVDAACEIPPAPGLGWGTKYYVESHPALLDSPGEWWYDASSGRLYLWPPEPGSPASQDIEISALTTGLDLKGRSHIHVDHLIFSLYNGDAIRNWNYVSDASIGNELDSCVLDHANSGVELTQVIEADNFPESGIEGFTVRSCEIRNMDTMAVHVADYWDDGTDPDAFERPGVQGTRITECLIHDIGLYNDGVLGDSPAGVVFLHPTDVTFSGNRVADISHVGLQVSKSTIQSDKDYGFSDSEIVAGRQLLFQDNVFEGTCLLKADCGAVKFWGVEPDTHVFRDVLLIGNAFCKTYGWSWAAQQRGLWSTGSVAGLGGVGIYLGNSSGVQIYRNEFHDIGYAGIHAARAWRDGPITIFDNVISNSHFGLRLEGLDWDTHDPVWVDVENNIFAGIEKYGVFLADADGVYSNVTIDHNLYGWVGWGTELLDPALMFIRHSAGQTFLPTLSDIQSLTPFEDHGLEGDPGFSLYDPDDHDLFDQSWPDFRLAPGSMAVDQGTTTLPVSLQNLLALFSITDDPRIGAAWDMGRYEGTTLPALSVSSASVVEGDSGQVTLTFPVTLSAASSEDVVLDYSTSSGSATAGSDYVPASDSLTIPAGAVTGSIEVVVLGDTEIEPDESLTVAITGAINAGIAQGAATGWIVSDDCGDVTITDLSVQDSDHYGTCGSIYAAPAVTVEDGGALQLNAGNRVVLRAGFSVGRGGQLLIEVGRPALP